MSTISSIKTTGIVAGIFAPLSLLQGATISQTNLNPNDSNLWNNSAVWGGNAVGSGNDYETVVGGTALGTSFAANGTTWQYYNNIRDTSGASPANTTFAGDSLILVSGSRLLMKGRNTTSEANIVMRDGSHIILANNGAGSGNLAGQIAVDDGALVAIGLQPHSGGSGNTLNVSSTFTGGVGSTVQLVLHGGSTNHLNITGDISGFNGTFLVSTSSLVSTGAGSTFSFVTGSAPLATLHLLPSANILFNLNQDLAFGSVIIGGDTPLVAGTYTFEDLDSLGYGSAFLSNGGSLTVIPEPSAALLGGLGVLAAAGIRRRRRHASC